MPFGVVKGKTKKSKKFTAEKGFWRQIINVIAANVSSLDEVEFLSMADGNLFSKVIYKIYLNKQF